MKEKIRGLAMIHCAVLLFGLTGLFARLIDLPAVFIVLGRVFFASLFLGVTLKARGVSLAVEKPRYTLLFFCSGAVLTLHWTTFFLSVKVSTVAVALITFSTFPLFLTFIEPMLFGEKIKIREIILAAVMLLGVRVVMSAAGMSGGNGAGIAYGMASSLSYAILSLINRKFAENYRGDCVAFFQQASATVILLPILFFQRPPISASDLALLVLLGVVFTGVAHSLYISGLKSVSGRSAGMIAGLETVYGIAAASLLLAEIPSINEIAGGAIILGAALVASWHSSEE